MKKVKESLKNISILLSSMFIIYIIMSATTIMNAYITSKLADEGAISPIEPSAWLSCVEVIWNVTITSMMLILIVGAIFTCAEMVKKSNIITGPIKDNNVDGFSIESWKVINRGFLDRIYKSEEDIIKVSSFELPSDRHCWPVIGREFIKDDKFDDFVINESGLYIIRSKNNDDTKEKLDVSK